MSWSGQSRPAGPSRPSRRPGRLLMIKTAPGNILQALRCQQWPLPRWSAKSQLCLAPSDCPASPPTLHAPLRTSSPPHSFCTQAAQALCNTTREVRGLFGAGELSAWQARGNLRRALARRWAQASCTAVAPVPTAQPDLATTLAQLSDPTADHEVTLSLVPRSRGTVPSCLLLCRAPQARSMWSSTGYSLPAANAIMRCGALPYNTYEILWSGSH